MFGVATFLPFRPRVTNGWDFIGLRVPITLDILLLADDTPKVLSVCLCLILISPRYFFFSSFM